MSVVGYPDKRSVIASIMGIRTGMTLRGGNAMIIKARIYIGTSDFSTYLQVVTELNMAIMKIMQNADAHFAQSAGCDLARDEGLREF